MLGSVPAWLVLIAVVTGCRGGASRSDPTGSGNTAVVHATADAAPPALPSSPIPDGARELVVALVDDWTATRAELRRYRRSTAGAAWIPVGEPWPGVVGRAGVAWGDGLHGLGPPAERPGPTKREGDGASPAGVFALRAAFGYAPSTTTALPYTQATDAWKCVDDVTSKAYASIVDRTATTVDWSSAEDMRRTDEQYRWVIDVAHNAARTPQHGSCIFLHVWAGADATTSGCTAMAEPDLQALVTSLPADAVFVLLPRAERAALAPSWRLP